MIKYDNYKSSEIDWLGDIPIDWEVKRVKDVSKINEKCINEKVVRNLNTLILVMLIKMELLMNLK